MLSLRLTEEPLCGKKKTFVFSVGLCYTGSTSDGYLDNTACPEKMGYYHMNCLKKTVMVLEISMMSICGKPILQVKLPDLEFFSNLGDWPLSERKKPPIPILSWCGSDETFDIVMPTYDLTESALEALGR